MFYHLIDFSSLNNHDEDNLHALRTYRIFTVSVYSYSLFIIILKWSALTV